MLLQRKVSCCSILVETLFLSSEGSSLGHHGGVLLLAHRTKGMVVVGGSALLGLLHEVSAGALPPAGKHQKQKQ